MTDPVTEASVLATSSMVITTNDSVWTLEVEQPRSCFITPVVCDRRWWWPLNAKWVGGLAMQTVNWVLTTQTFTDYLSGNYCFLCRDFKNLRGCDDCFCYITAKFAGISNKLSRPVVVILERRKRNFFYLRILLLVMWDIEVYQILAPSLDFSFWWPQFPSCMFLYILPERYCKRDLSSQWLGSNKHWD